MRRLIKKWRKEADTLKRNNTSENFQNKWAKWMSRRTAKFKRRHWLMTLVLFVLLAGGYNLYLASEGIFSKGKSILLSVYAIHKPWFIKVESEMITDSSLFIPGREHERIHSFKLYMDSLAQSPSGKRIYDSIMVSRPGLMDSVLAIVKSRKEN